MVPGGFLNDLTPYASLRNSQYTHTLSHKHDLDTHAHMRIKIPPHFEAMSERIHHGDSTTSTHFFSLSEVSFLVLVPRLSLVSSGVLL